MCFSDGFRDKCTEANIECAEEMYSTFLSLQDGEGFISLTSFASATAYVEQTYVPRRTDHHEPAELQGTLIGCVYKACVGDGSVAHIIFHKWRVYFMIWSCLLSQCVCGYLVCVAIW